MTDINKTLSSKVKTDPCTKLPKWYQDFLDVFSRKKVTELLSLQGTGIDHEIQLEKVDGKEPQVPWGPLYNMSHDKLLVLQKTLTEYLDKGFVQVNNFPVTVPVLFVQKPEGRLRFCVNYRGLNRFTRKDRYPFPLIYETFQSINQVK